MPDYKELYLKMVRASEEAIRILIKAQQDCEELYLQDTDDQSLLLEEKVAFAKQMTDEV